MKETHMRSSSNKEKLEQTSEKLIKIIKFEVEVQKSLGSSTIELHKKRLREIQRCLK